MIILELAALCVVALYVVSRTILEEARKTFLFRLFLISIACWLAEESSILLYNFYSYNPSWSIFLGHVPLLVVLAWPVIIHSAWDLASQILHAQRRLVALATGAIVCTDASVIEPVSVNFGLWSWNEPGIFHVPPIGILGWAYFAFLCVFLLQKGGTQKGSSWLKLLLPVLPVIGTHLLLLLTWWGALRWINGPVNSTVVAGVAWALSLALVYRILRRRTGSRVERKTLLLRLPAALLLFLVLALNASGSAWLVVYALAFAPPYLTLMAQQYLAYDPKTVN